MHGDLVLYKLYARFYDGKTGNNLMNTWYDNVFIGQKWTNLYDMMIIRFKGKGRNPTPELYR